MDQPRKHCLGNVSASADGDWLDGCIDGGLIIREGKLRVGDISVAKAIILKEHDTGTETRRLLAEGVYDLSSCRFRRIDVGRHAACRIDDEDEIDRRINAQ